MRDPNRIEPFLQKIKEFWENKCPDWRFSQLIYNFMFAYLPEATGRDIFFIEDDELLELLEKFSQTM